MIGLVLATDFTKHNSLVFRFQNRKLDCFENDEEKSEIFEFFIHAGDISNPSRPWDLSKKWVDLIIEEYFNQGDRERALGLEISIMCDRFDTKVPSSQLFFINSYVLPIFKTLQIVAPKVQVCIDNCEENCKVWKELLAIND